MMNRSMESSMNNWYSKSHMYNILFNNKNTLKSSPCMWLENQRTVGIKFKMNQIQPFFFKVVKPEETPKIQIGNSK